MLLCAIASDLDASTKQVLQRGERLTQKQDQFATTPTPVQVVMWRTKTHTKTSRQLSCHELLNN
jgi:F0F1-type ATP synthase alpha subunit